MTAGTVVAIVAGLGLATIGPAHGAQPRKPTGSLRVVFAATGTIRLDGERRFVSLGDNECYARETTHESASVDWNQTWGKVRLADLSRPGGPRALLRITQQALVSGGRVRDDCDHPGEAPPDWIGSESCQGQGVTEDQGSLTVVGTSRSTRVVVALAAPALGLPLTSGCGMQIRNDQFTAHVSVKRSVLQRLKKGKALSIAVGTARPGSGDLYEPSINCARPEKPYDTYRIDAVCANQVTWSGRVTFVKL